MLRAVALAARWLTIDRDTLKRSASSAARS